MKLWLLTTSHGGYDCYDSMIIAANTAQKARAIAANKHGDEGAVC